MSDLLIEEHLKSYFSSILAYNNHFAYHSVIQSAEKVLAPKLKLNILDL